MTTTQTPVIGPTRRQLLAVSALATAGLATPPALAQEPTALARIRTRGTLVVAVYNDLPPFNSAGQGIDVALAQALASQLGLKLSLLPFAAGENMNDDLRNMVWKGHYLGFGPADVLLHVPVDKPLMAENPRALIFAPYYRERVLIARNIAQAPHLNTLDDLAGLRIAVPGQSLAGWLLIGAEGGKYQPQLSTKWADGTQAAAALLRGEVAAEAGQSSELESVLGGDARFVIEALPLPRMRDGWVIGCAVKRESEDLARELQQAMNTLADNGELARMFRAGKLSWRRP